MKQIIKDMLLQSLVKPIQNTIITTKNFPQGHSFQKEIWGYKDFLLIRHPMFLVD